MYRDTMRDVIETAKGISGIIFVDAEGEAIDWAANMDENELKIIGAHFSIFFNTLKNFGSIPHSIIITMHPYLLGMYRITEDYFLLVLYISSYEEVINRSRVNELISFIKNSL